MTGFDVTAAELSAGAAFGEDVRTELSNDLARIAALVEDVLTSSWRGDAASAFGIAWTEWATGAREAVAALSSMSASLRGTGASYLAAERASVLGR
jgi:WXG100 family type VII secretion target